LFARLRELIQHGWYDVPNTKRYAGTGGWGNFLEDKLGLNVGSQDIADSVGWEIKYYTKQTHLITLFHKEAQPPEIMRYMVRKWGWKDENGRLSFRHTIKGRSDRFKVETDGNQIIVRPLKGNGPVPKMEMTFFYLWICYSDSASTPIMGGHPMNKPNKQKSLEDKYEELFKYMNVLPEGSQDESSLEQPSPLQVVPSLTTYGAYEEPVIGQ
jgi:hypothetical protein